MPPLEDLASLAPCSHEEADSRMLMHASHAAQHGYHKILIQMVDTDAVGRVCGTGAATRR